MDDRNGLEPDQSHADSRVLVLAVEHLINDYANGNISQERSLEIAKHLMELAKRKKHIRTSDLASVIGEIQYTKAQFKRGALHIKQLQKLKVKEIASRGWNKWTQINKSVIPNLTWWISKLALNQPLCFMKPNRRITIQTDASTSGWGATLIRENQEKVFAHGE
ncbi:MAG: hypothetical protein EZS28_020878 [Streblomastix strix]|uniref:Uncharacterized protein n=1 Tax=Streblomastix strix TaxID=222440 RepID=A0A5J4VMU6_9EUKA|nr:MAG: hypothetical protein EZS28_020878 [Streblomastix strix]